MSFQGDVAGIGLANLLQSLARGRVGVLTLKSKSGLTATLGLHTGNLHLLPEPGEDAEIWRQRVRRAFARDPNVAVDALRMSDVAAAVRLETLYQLLDSHEVHFRFKPGPLPERTIPSASSQPEESVTRAGQSADAVFCNEIPLEGLLLEFARLSDDLERHGGAPFVTDDVVPFVIGAYGPGEGMARFYQECDGDSTLVEIGDRLSWPMRQVRLVAWQQIAAGMIRLAEAHELIELAQRELLEGNSTRAGARLHAWCLQSWPGPPQPQEADMLANEWSAGRLQYALKTMPQRPARTLLRRLDHALGNPLGAVQHWKEYAEIFRGDVVGQMHLLVCQIRDQADPNSPPLRELLTVAAQLREADMPMRAAVFLRIAAARQVETVQQQIEIGTGLVGVGAVEEGAPWIEVAASALIDAGEPEKAVAPLRALVEADRHNRQARRLLHRARARAMRRSFTKKHAAIGLAILATIACGAWVQVRLRADYDRRLDEIEAMLDRPHDALRLLEASFEGDDSQRVVRLRETVERRRLELERKLRTEWTDRYTQAQHECTLGDPVLGLKRALELEAPPLPDDTRHPWPLVTDLFNCLAARLETELEALGTKVVDTPEQTRGEERLQRMTDDLLAPLSERNDQKVDAVRDRLYKMAKRLRERAEQRASEREERARSEHLALLDRLLATARSHAEAGDLSRALQAYRKVVDADQSGKIEEALRGEIDKVTRQHDGIVRALELAQAGRHAEARDVLAATLGSERGMPLPWRVDSFPPGARVRFVDGSVRATPFEIHSAFGEVVPLVFEAQGYEPLALEVDQPADRLVYLSRTPETAWPAAGRVDAMPVAVGEDHIAADRSGELVRIGPGGNLVWRRELPALGGVARAPVFLPRKPGHLLLITEDGEAWLIEAATGAVDGPWEVGAPPVAGPIASQDGVVASFADGQELRWELTLKPTPVGSRTPVLDVDLHRHGADSGLSVLRRQSASQGRLASPWTDWSVEVRESVFAVLQQGRSEPLFTVRREGDWVWLAWEAPHALAPRGRLWASDGAGLRAFQPATVP